MNFRRSTFGACYYNPFEDSIYICKLHLRRGITAALIHELCERDLHNLLGFSKMHHYACPHAANCRPHKHVVMADR